MDRMNDPSQMMSRSFGMWQQPSTIPPPTTDDPMGFQNPRSQLQQQQQIFPMPVLGAKHGRVAKWKGKKKKPTGVGGDSGYRPPTLNELQYQNRVKARRFYPNNSSNNRRKFSRFAPYAPRNTTSFIIRAKKAGGIASLVSPCPVTPAILPTPKFSPSREGLVDMAKEEWGVDGYGSMKGLIRLRSGTPDVDVEDGEEGEDGSSESDVEEHVEVERRLDHDLSRFEMVCHPNFGEEHGGLGKVGYLLENRVDDQDTHIAQLEEENLTLKERLFLMEREMGELRTRLQLLEAGFRGRGEEYNNENVHEEASDNDDPGGVQSCLNNDSANEEASDNEGAGDVRSCLNISNFNEASDNDCAAGNMPSSLNDSNVNEEASENEGGGVACLEKSTDA